MYVVAGVSGRTGSVVADRLLAAGKPVRVLIRDPAQGESWRRRGAETALASLDDDASLARALEGAVGAYLLSPQNPRSADPITDGWKIAQSIARAIEASSLAHLVMLSALNAELAEGTGIIRTLHAAEERLAGASTRMTFVRAAYLLENWAPVLPATAGGRLPTFIRSEQTLAMVSTRDIGAVAARALLEGPPPDRRDIIALLGPRDYSPRDLAAGLTRLLGRTIEPEHAPLEAVVPAFTGMGASAAFAEQVRLLHEGIAEGRAAGSTAGARVIRGTVEAETVFAALLKR